jgi:sialic acid synthase SpsE
LSTGFSSLGQVECAVESLNESGLKGKTILLQCTAEYPAPIDEINLRAIVTMQQAFGCPVGFSDHTEGSDAGPWSVAIGSCVVEKHFTLDRNMAGPDHRASLEPDEFSDLVRKIRQIERSLGDGIKRIMPSELKNKLLMQKSLVARKAIKAGETITPDSLTCKRPGTGLSPAFYDQVVGKKADRDIEENEILTLSSIEWNS